MFNPSICAISFSFPQTSICGVKKNVFSSQNGNNGLQVVVEGFKLGKSSPGLQLYSKYKFPSADLELKCLDVHSRISSQVCRLILTPEVQRQVSPPSPDLQQADAEMWETLESGFQHSVRSCSGQKRGRNSVLFYLNAVALSFAVFSFLFKMLIRWFLGFIIFSNFDIYLFRIFLCCFFRVLLKTTYN